MKKLSLADNGFLQAEKATTPTHVGGLTIHKVPDGVALQTYFEDLLGNLRNWFAATAPFNQRLQTAFLNAGVPSLVPEPHLDLDYHMRRMALPQPGSLAQLCELVAEMHAKLLHRDHPLWEFRLIEGVEGNRFALYFKVHHSIMDGIAAMNAMKSLMSTDPQADTIAPLRSSRRQASATSSRGLTARLAQVAHFLQTRAKAMPELAKAFKDVGLQLWHADPADPSVVPVWYTAPVFPINTPISNQRSIILRSFALKDFKAISKAHGVTINDVVLACCSGALRSYFLLHNNLPEKSLISCLPVSLRAKSGSSQGNAITSLLCNMGTHLEDPLTRLQHIHTSTANGKEQLRHMSKPAIETFTLMIGAPFFLGQMLKINKVLPTAFNMVISNLQASDKKLYLCGAEMESLYPINLLFERQALNFTVSSYVDSLDFTLLACRQTIPDLERIAEFLSQSLEELAKASGLKRPRGKRQPSARTK